MECLQIGPLGALRGLILTQICVVSHKTFSRRSELLNFEFSNLRVWYAQIARSRPVVDDPLQYSEVFR